MSEAPHAPAPKSGSVKLPGLGPVPKKWFLIVGGGAVLTIGYVLYKRKSGAAATTAGATADTTALTGQPCTDANGMPGVYDASGVCQATQGAAGGYYAGQGALGVSGVTPPVPGTGGFTTNGQWSQQAQADLAGTGVDPAALAAALGAYLTGQALTTAQQSLVDQAIADEGYPPVAGPGGFPPAMRTSATGGSGSVAGQPCTDASGKPGLTDANGVCQVTSTGGGGTGTGTGTGTGGGTTPPPASVKFPAPGGLRASAVSDSGYSLNWNAVTSGGHSPSGYTVATYDSHGALVDEFTAGGTATKEYGRGGRGLAPKTTYHTNVWANGGSVAPPHATVTVTTLAKK